MIQLGEFFQCFIQRQDFLFALGGECDGFVESYATRASAALLSFLLAGVIDEDPADRLAPTAKKCVRPCQSTRV